LEKKQKSYIFASAKTLYNLHYYYFEMKEHLILWAAFLVTLPIMAIAMLLKVN